MEGTQQCPTYSKNKISKPIAIPINSIIKAEYSLKRNNFNPFSKSPNDFHNRLEIRMKQYYNVILQMNK
jgi:hypothetical protein